MAVLDWLLGGLTGACAGYITNDLALRLMFSGMPGLKIEPLVTKSKSRLGDSLGRVVQARLLHDANHPDGGSPLGKQLEQQPVADALQNSFQDLFASVLPGLLENQTLSNLPGYEKTADGFRRVLADFLQRHAPDLLQNLLESVSLSDLLPPPQQTTILSRLLEITADALSTENYPFDRLTEALRGCCIADLLGEDASQKLGRQCSRNGMEAVIQDICSDTQRLQTLFRSAGLEGAVYTALSSVLEQPLSEWITKDTLEDCFRQAAPVLQEMIQRESFAALLTDFSQTIVAVLHRSELPVSEIFPDAAQDKLAEFLSCRLPALMPYLAAYLQDREAKINAMMEEEVDSVIQDGTSHPLANGVRQLLRDVILEKIREADLIRMIEDYADSLLRSDELKTACQEGMHRLFSSLTVGELTQHCLSAEQLARQLQQLCSAFPAHVPDAFYQIIGNLKPARFLGEKAIRQMADRLVARAVPAVADAVCQLPEEKRHDLVQTGAETLYRQANRLLHLDLAELSPALVPLRQKAGQALSRQRRPLVKKIQAKLQTISLSKIKVNAQRLTAWGTGAFDAGLRRIKQTRLSSLAERLAHTTVPARIATFLQQRLSGAFPRWLAAGDKIKTYVSGKIQAMSNAWLGRCMQAFAGRELRPLCIMGAILGGLIGTALAFLPTMPGALAVRILLFALIGVLTNWLAFYGLFRPYTPKKWLPGFSYLPRRIPQAAHAFGTAVDRFLMDEDSMRALFAQYQPSLTQSLTGLFTENRLTGYLTDHQEELAGALSRLLCNLLRENEDACVDWLVKKAEQVTPEEITDRLFSLLQSRREDILPVLRALLDSPLSLRDCFPSLEEQAAPRVRQAVSRWLDVLAGQYLQPDAFKRMAVKLEPAFQQWLANPLRRYLPAQSEECICARIAHWTTAQLFSEASGQTTDFLCDQFYDELYQVIGAESPETIGSFLHGRLSDFLDSRMEEITRQQTEQLLVTLEFKKPELTGKILDAVYESTNLFVCALVDLDDLVEQAVSRVIRHGLAQFFAEETGNIAGYIRRFLHTEIDPLSLSCFDLKTQEIQIRPLVSEMLSDSALRRSAETSVNTLCRMILPELAGQPLAVFADIIRIKSLSDCCDRLQRPLVLLSDGLRAAVTDNPCFTDAVSHDLMDVLGRCIFDRPIGKLTALCEEDALMAVIANLFDWLTGQRPARLFLQEFLGQLQQTQPMNRKVCREACLALLRHPALQKSLSPGNCGLFLQSLLQESVMTEETRDYIASIAVSAAAKTIEAHLPELLQAIDVPAVTVRMVGAMDGRQLHQMFEEFAAPYFRQLIQLGGTGFLFGWPGARAACAYLLLSAGYLLTRRQEKGKE